MLLFVAADSRAGLEFTTFFNHFLRNHNRLQFRPGKHLGDGGLPIFFTLNVGKFLKTFPVDTPTAID